MGSKFIKVQSAVEGFRRGGHSFGREPVTLDTSDLTKEQLAAIRGEPMLVVIDCEDPSASEKASAPKGAAAKAAAEKAAAEKAAAEKAAAEKAEAEKAEADKANGNA